MNLPVPLDRPAYPGEWEIDKIIEKLSRHLPESITETRKQGNATLTYIPWPQVNRILDKYAPGWKWEIKQIQTTADRIFLVGRLSIPTLNGLIWREASGTELLKEINREGEMRELAYGDPSSNAESMAFRRAASRFGLGLYLYLYL